MRSKWLLAVALIAAASGCATTGNTPPVPQPAVPQQSWTDKVAAPFKSLAPKKSPAVAKTSEVDPISLEYSTGPTTPALYVSMARMSDQSGNVPNARSMYNKALSIDPKNLVASLGLARLEDREGNLPVALQHYRRAVNNHPQDARAHNDLGLCHARAGDMQASLQCLEHAVRLQPEKALYRNNIAKVLIEVNQFEGALAHLAAVNHPAVANYNMAALLEERGRGREAIPYLQRALAANPQLTEASVLLAALTGGSPATQQAMASAPRTTGWPRTAAAPTAQIQVSAPMAGAASMATQASANEEIGRPGYVPTEPINVQYPSTGAPRMVPQPQEVPSQTALAPVGYEPAMLPPIR